VSLILEVIAQLIFEVLAFGIGRVFVFLFLPWYSIEPLSRPAEQGSPWKWRGFAYQEKGRRFLRVETVQLIGVVILIALIVMVATLSKA
jgi:hypothetical protein